MDGGLVVGDLGTVRRPGGICAALDNLGGSGPVEADQPGSRVVGEEQALAVGGPGEPMDVTLSLVEGSGAGAVRVHHPESVAPVPVAVEEGDLRAVG
jgi:hypothetical protein